jgi:hypothetical protein
LYDNFVWAVLSSHDDARVMVAVAWLLLLQQRTTS